jgi:hypothetical protein
LQGRLEHPPIVVRARRGRGPLTLASLRVGATARPAMILGGGVFGMVGALGLCTTLAPPRIGPGGLVQTVLWRRISPPWSQVCDFRPITIGLTTRTVGFDVSSERPLSVGLRAPNAAVAEAEGALSPGWEIDPRALAPLLKAPLRPPRRPSERGRDGGLSG